MVDIWLLQGLVGRLMEEGETFDPAVARELFDAVPEGKIASHEIHYRSSGGERNFTGHTEHGDVSFPEEKKKEWNTNNSKGLWVGRWQVCRENNYVAIVERFARFGEPLDFYVLRFHENGRIEFGRAYYTTFSLSLPRFGFHNWLPYVKGWYSFKYCQGRIATWKLPLEPDGS